MALAWKEGDRFTSAICSGCGLTHGSGVLCVDYTKIDNYYCVKLDRSACGGSRHCHASSLTKGANKVKDPYAKIDIKTISLTDQSLSIPYDLSTGTDFWYASSLEKTEGESEVRTKMTHKYKIGDRVKHSEKGIGTVKHTEFALGIEYDSWTEGHNGCGSWEGRQGYCWNEDSNDEAIKLISSVEKTMTNLNKLTKEQKAGLSKENQAMLELGLINQDLTPNEEGFEYMTKFLFTENRDALAKKAIAEVAEAKAEAKKKEAKA